MDFINLQTPQTTVKEGIFYLGQDPVYFIEYLSEGGLYDSVTVYEAKRGGNGEVGKVQEKVSIPKEAPGKSILSSKFNSPVQKNEVKISPKPPLFLAPVVEGTNSFKGADELGFYDREPDKIRYTGDPETGVRTPTIVEGKRTGLFIGLSSIKWVKEYIPSEQILNRFVAEQRYWSGLYDTQLGTGD